MFGSPSEHTLTTDRPSTAPLAAEASASAKPSARAGLAVWTLLVLVFAIPALVVAYEGAMHFSGIAIDGPFQLYNALRRIEAGFTPGIDFQFFHGMGVPFAHYWLYRLLGGGLAGSELSRQLIETSVYVVVFLVVIRAFARTWPETLCLTTAALAVSWILKFTVLMFAQIGMLGLRSALPTVLPAALYLARARRTRIVAGGATLGIALLMGTEQGIAATIAYVIVMAIVALRDPGHRDRLVEGAATIGTAIATLVVLLWVIGGVAGMRGVLRYNFSTVPKDQYWYFGVPPNQFISSWGGLVTLVRVWPVGLAMVIALALCVWYGARTWRAASEPETDDTRRTIALATLPLYGLISCGSLLGALTVAYAQPLWRVLLIVALLESAAWCARRTARGTSRWWLGVPRAFAAAVLVLSAVAIVRVRLIATSLYVAAVHIPRDHLARHVGFSAGGIWPQTLRDGQAIIDAHRGPNGKLPLLWSSYSGWIEARNGLFNPSFDYMIHSLGHDNRQTYVEKFRTVEPALAQTMSPMYSGYEPWLENSNWQFYDELLDWYDVVGNTPWSLYWERRASRAPALVPLDTIAVAPGAQYVVLPPVSADVPTPASVLEVEVDYTVHNPLKFLPLIGASPRYLIGIGGAYNDTPISLAPYETRARFLLFASPGQTPSLHFQTFSLLPGASYTPRVVRVYRRVLDERTRTWAQLMLQRYTSQMPR